MIWSLAIEFGTIELVHLFLELGQLRVVAVAFLEGVRRELAGVVVEECAIRDTDLGEYFGVPDEELKACRFASIFMLNGLPQTVQ